MKYLESLFLTLISCVIYFRYPDFFPIINHKLTNSYFPLNDTLMKNLATMCFIIFGRILGVYPVRRKLSF
jgi:hypothetical protein